MSLLKKHLKTRPVCKATFALAADVAPENDAIWLVGDFNNWDNDSLPMKKKKDGSWSLEIELEPGREYQFLYHIGGNTYLNDAEADAHVPNPFGTGVNSVIHT